jgi:hypothetical protein
MAVKFPPPGLVVLLPAVLVVMLVGLGRPCMVLSDTFVAVVVALADIVELSPLLAAVVAVLLTDVVLLDIPAAASAPVLLFSGIEHILCIDDIIVLLPPYCCVLLSDVVVFAVVVVLLLWW